MVLIFYFIFNFKNLFCVLSLVAICCPLSLFLPCLQSVCEWEFAMLSPILLILVQCFIYVVTVDKDIP